MALNIKDSTADALARAVAARTGETLTQAIVEALKERLARLDRVKAPSLKAELEAIRKRCAKLKVRDARSADAIIGYDKNGLPR
jgi:antitoxin VapB